MSPNGWVFFFERQGNLSQPATTVLSLSPPSSSLGCGFELCREDRRGGGQTCLLHCCAKRGNRRERERRTVKGEDPLSPFPPSYTFHLCSSREIASQGFAKCEVRNGSFPLREFGKRANPRFKTLIPRSDSLFALHLLCPEGNEGCCALQKRVSHRRLSECTSAWVGKRRNGRFQCSQRKVGLYEGNCRQSRKWYLVPRCDSSHSFLTPPCLITFFWKEEERRGHKT